MTEFGVGEELHPTNLPGVFARNVKLTPHVEITDHGTVAYDREGNVVGGWDEDPVRDQEIREMTHAEWLARHNMNESANVPNDSHTMVSFMSGRQNGKMRTYNVIRRAEEACGPGVRVDPAWHNSVFPAPLWQREDRRAVDRSFENEVRLHG